MTEGETELQYIKPWRMEHRDTVLIDARRSKRSDARGVVQEARDLTKADKRSSTATRFEEAWAVFDVDNNGPYLDEALEMARANNVNVALSNPCFEIWLVLHFEDLRREITGEKVRERSRELVGRRKSSHPLPPDAGTNLKQRYEDARLRAAELDKQHGGAGLPPTSCPSSGMWRLIESIRRPIASRRD